MPNWSLWRVTKNYKDMKPSTLDELDRQEIDAPGIIAERGQIMDGWDSPFKSIGYNGIKDLIESKRFDEDLKGQALEILENIFFLDSAFEVIENSTDDRFLLSTFESKNATPPKIIIDLCHETIDDFFGKYPQNTKGNLEHHLLDKIKRNGFIIYGLKEIRSILSNMKNTNTEKTINRGDIIADCISEKKSWKLLMTSLFHGEHNWNVNPSYMTSKNNLLPYHIMCYESLAYIREDRNYIIETEPLNNVCHAIDINQQIAIFACYSTENPDAKRWTGSTSIKFLGKFKIDKVRSEQEKHLAFKLDKDRIII